MSKNKCNQCGHLVVGHSHHPSVCVGNLQAKIIDISEKMMELKRAAKPFLVDDTVCTIEPTEDRNGVWQCAHCGAHATDPKEIRHFMGCSGERLRKAVEAAEVKRGQPG